MRNRVGSQSLDAASAAVIVEKTGKTLDPDDCRVSDGLSHTARHFSAVVGCGVRIRIAARSGQVADHQNARGGRFPGR